MQKIENPFQDKDPNRVDSGVAGSFLSGKWIGDHFRSVVERATDFLSSLASNSSPSGVDLSNVRETVFQASPYLASTPDGVIYYTSQLETAATTIQRALYDIPPSRGPEDYKQRIVEHHQFIDDTVWIPLTGVGFQDLVKYYFQKEGIHCHTPEVLERESKHFVNFIADGDSSRFSELLMWALKDNPKIVDNLLSRLG